jgi:hypothetical protein
MHVVLGIQELAGKMQQKDAELRELRAQLITANLQRDESSGENARLLQKLIVKEEETRRRARRHA